MNPETEKPEKEKVIHTSSTKRKWMLILMLAIGFLFVALLFLSRSRSIPAPTQPEEQTAKSETQLKSYDEMVAAGDIEPAYKVLEVGVAYNKDANPQLSFNSFSQKNGYTPKVLPGEETHNVQVLSQDGVVLAERPFSIPHTFYSETFENGNPQSKSVTLPQVSFAFTLPWFDTTTTVRIVDKKGSVIISSPLTNVEIVNNTPDFQGIFSKQTPTPTPQKINLFKNFLIPPLYAQAAEKKLTIAVLSDSYTDQNKFNADVQARWLDFFSFEPFKTRQSQIQIFSVWNTTPLKCGFNPKFPGQKFLSCDLQLATQLLNRSGVPHDIFVIMHMGSDTDPNIRGIAYQYSSTTQKGIVITNATSPVRVHEFVHELGHAFGYLMDEYAFNNKDGDIINSPARVSGIDPVTGNILGFVKDDSNCYSGNPPVKEWAGLVNQFEYRKGCTFPNWFSPSWDSLMSSALVDAEATGLVSSQKVAYAKKFLCFNKVSQKVLNKRLDATVGSFSGGEVPLAECPLGGYCQIDVLRQDPLFQQNRSKVCSDINSSASSLVNNGTCQSREQTVQIIRQLCNEPAPTATTAPTPTRSTTPQPTVVPVMTKSAQLTCPGGIAQIAFSFTNTDSTRSVDLYVDDTQTKKYFATQLTVAPNKTITGTIPLGQVVVNNGNVIFSYFWIDPTKPTGDPNVPVPTDDPTKPTPDPNKPVPTPGANEGGQLTVPYNAINCAAVTSSPIGGGGGTTPVPSSTILGDCQVNGSCPSGVAKGAPTGGVNPAGGSQPGSGGGGGGGGGEFQNFLDQLFGIIREYIPGGGSSTKVKVSGGKSGSSTKVKVSGSKKRDFCFIATAAYGTSMAEDVRYLRVFRDEYLLTNSLGSKFVALYYAVSPPLAQELSKHDGLRAVVRVALVPFVTLSRWTVNTEAVDRYK